MKREKVTNILKNVRVGQSTLLTRTYKDHKESFKTYCIEENEKEKTFILKVKTKDIINSKEMTLKNTIDLVDSKYNIKNFFIPDSVQQLKQYTFLRDFLENLEFFNDTFSKLFFSNRREQFKFLYSFKMMAENFIFTIYNNEYDQCIFIDVEEKLLNDIQKAWIFFYS